MRPSDSLAEYDEVLVVSVNIGGKRRTVPVYKFIEKFLWVEDDDGNKVPMILREEQCELYAELCKQKMAGKPMRVDILKARQIGFSTFIAAMIFVLTLFVPGRKAAIVADIAEHASNLFRKYQFFYRNLPVELQLPLVASNAKELVVDHGNGQQSSIRIMVQGEQAGRSGTYQYLHLSECAFWQDLKRTLVALLQTVSSANKDSIVFFETTGNGFNDYKRRWDRDVQGLTPYKALFFSWWQHRAYRRDTHIGRLYEWEETMRKKYDLDYRQLAFYREKWQEADQDIDMVRQEFPSSAMEAFKTTGNSVFPLDLIASRKDEILKRDDKTPPVKGRFRYEKHFSEDGARIDLTDSKFVRLMNGAITIYEEPIEGHPYICNLDPAMGGEDFYAIQVIDNSNLHQVAVFHDNKCDDDDVAYQLYLLGKAYNGALLSGECNNPNGSYILQTCEACGSDNIYQDTDYEALTDRYADRFGYKTKQNNKNVMVTKLKLAFRDDPRMINDYGTLCEMEEFEIVKSETGDGKEKFQAQSGRHDDYVTSLCGALYVRGSQSCLVGSQKSQNEKSSLPPQLTERSDDGGQQTKKVYQIWD